jgi:hypothetical protein
MAGRQSFKVEQITTDSRIVRACDQPMSTTEQELLFRNCFGVVIRKKIGFLITIKGHEYHLLTKAVTYLGYPWEAHKKRIQVPHVWNALLRQQNTLLIGVYRYKENVLFVFFDKRQRGKNSAAHVSSLDLLKANQYGYFEKTDHKGNRVVTCTKEKVLEVLMAVATGSTLRHADEVEVMSKYFKSLPHMWNGISIYKEMFAADFAHKRQGEWPGFYAEFCLEQFLRTAPRKTREICQYTKRKKDGDLDFDIEFTKAGFIGDLKTHAIDSKGIPGNDKKSFFAALKRYGILWYVVLKLRYRQDRDVDLAVTKFWNELINQTDPSANKDPLSYAQRMKHDGELLEMQILEFNKYNFQYVADFQQGKQPNGAAREIKIMISNKNIDNFVIYREKFDYPATRESFT